MKLFHRSQVKLNEIDDLSFYTEGAPIDDLSYGAEIMCVEVNGDLATEEEVLSVVKKLGYETDEADMTYEYLSKNLGTIPQGECYIIADELRNLGYIGAKLPDFCCEESVILFEEAKTIN